MKKIFFSFTLLCTVLFSKAQVTFSHQLTHSDIVSGDTISLTLKNTGPDPVKIYFKYWKPGLEFIFQTEEEYLNYLRNSCGVDSSEFARELAYAQAHILKEEFVNACPSAEPDWNDPDMGSVIEKMNSIIGAKLASYSLQCGEKAEMTQLDFIATDLIDFDSIRVVSCDGHVLNDIWYKGKYALMDQDITSHLHLPNWESFDELVNVGDTSWLSRQHWYRYTNRFGDLVYPNNGFTWASKMDWLSILQSNRNNYGPQVTQTYAIDGDVVLCDGCTISATEIEEYDHSVDLDLVPDLTNDLQSFMAIIDDCVFVGDTAQAYQILDSLMNFMAGRLNRPKSDIENMFASGNVKLNHGSRPWFPTYGYSDVPQLIYTFPQRAEPYILGTDAKFPGYVLEINLTEGDSVLLWDIPGDDTLITAQFKVQIWDQLKDQEDQGPGQLFVTNKQVHYLQNGYVDASEGDVKIKVSYNPNLIGFFHPIDLEILDGDPNTISFDLKSPQSNIVGIKDQKRGVVIYPNPTTGLVTITGSVGKTIIYDLQGKQVFKSIENTFDISELPAGMYFLNLPNGEKRKIVKQ
jgi:hypothetical protein